MPGMEIVIGADISELISGINKASEEMLKFKKQAQDNIIASAFTSAIKPINQLESEISALNNAIKNTTSVTELKKLNDQAQKLERQINNMKVIGFETSLHKIELAAKGATGSLAKVGPGGANQAAFALQNLGRVAQDAPFGFIGIANNINPLLESFQRLKVESGSSGGAIKALVASLAGAGGLGLAVSLGSAALSLFGMAMQKSGSEAKKAAEKVDEYGKLIKDIASKTAEQVSSIDILVKAYERENLSHGQRITIINKLKEISPEYFGQLKSEKTSVDALTVAYNAYAKSIDNSIIADIKKDRLRKIIERRIQLSAELNLIEPDTKFNALLDIPKTAKRAIDEANSIIKKNPFQKINDEPIIEDSTITEYRYKLDEINKLNKEAFDIEIDLSKTVDFKVTDPKKIKEKIKKHIREAYSPAIGLELITSAQILLDQQAAEKEINDKLGKVKMKPIKLNLDSTEIYRKMQELAKYLDQQNRQIAENVKSTFNAALSGIGESLAEALTGGKDLGQTIFGNFFKVIGAGLKQMGEAMIAIGTAKIALEKFKFAPGIGTVVAGIAAVAIGSIIQNAIPKFAVGTQNFRGGVAMVGERGPELVNLPKGSGVIPNDKLGSITGGQSVHIYGEFVQRGQHLVAVVNQTNKMNGRAF